MDRSVAAVVGSDLSPHPTMRTTESAANTSRVRSAMHEAYFPRSGLYKRCAGFVVGRSIRVGWLSGVGVLSMANSFCP